MSHPDALVAVLDHHPDIMATALLHLATHRRGVATVADVLAIPGRTSPAPETTASVRLLITGHVTANLARAAAVLSWWKRMNVAPRRLQC